MLDGRAVLKSITNRDYRKQIETLLDDGWKASRTGKNHFRLSHPQAYKDVITSGTPSDHRAAENLKGQCRRALLPPAGDIEPSRPFPLIELPESVKAASSRSKPRWTEEDRNSRKKGKSPIAETTKPIVSPFPFKPVKPDLTKIGDNVHQALIKGAQEIKIAEAVIPEPNTTTEFANIGTQDKDYSEMTVALPNTPTPTPHPVLSLVTTAPAAAQAAEAILPVLNADLLTVAMRILSGELRSISITPDMVGKTLVLGAEGWIVDGHIKARKAPIVKQETAEKPEAKSQVPQAFEENDQILTALSEALETFKGSWLPLTDIMALVSKPEGTTDRGHKECIRRRLNHMTSKGQIERKQSGTSPRARVLYRMAAWARSYS